MYGLHAGTATRGDDLVAPEYRQRRRPTKIRPIDVNQGARRILLEQELTEQLLLHIKSSNQKEFPISTDD